MSAQKLGISALLALSLAACGSSSPDAPPTDETGDAEDACALCASGKADGWSAPAAGSCEANAMLDVANTASFEELDDDAALNRTAARNIVDRREADGAYASLTELDAVAYVGPSAMRALLDYADARGLVDACTGGAAELGLVSDLDQTVIPPHETLADVAPYPGVAKLYQVLELRNGGVAGDLHYVTARTPEKVVDVPAWLDEHGVPGGNIDTGISGVPWVAQAEKVRDISAIIEKTPDQPLVLFGDTSHRDPEVYREIKKLFPERVAAALVQKVTTTLSPARVEGLHVYTSYAEAAAILYGLSLIDESEARSVMEAARDEGLDISDQEMDALLEAHSP